MTNTLVAFEQPIQTNSIDEVNAPATISQLTLDERVALVDPEQFKRCLLKVVGVIHFKVIPGIALNKFTCTIGTHHFTMTELLSVKDRYLV